MRRLLAHFACLLCGLLAATPAGAVVGGEQTTIDQVPWQVGLRIVMDGQGFLCGGSIADATHVVTAAHCVQDGTGVTQPPGAFTVVAGSSKQPWAPPEAGSQVRAVSAVAVHPLYSAENQARDAAVLTLAEPLDLSGARARAVALGDQPQLALWDGVGGDRAVVSGWGATDRAGTMLSPTVKRATVPVLRDGSASQPGTCQGAWQGGYVASVMLCGGTASEDTCSGDSGGPAVVLDAGTPVLAGITSFGGQLCADVSAPGVYTEVAGVRGFLQPASAPPQRQTGPSVAGTPRVGETLTCDPGTWSGAPTFAFEWLRVDVAPAAGLPSGGAPSYVLRAEDAGTRVACRVTATNSAGPATATSDAIGPVAAAEPPEQPQQPPTDTGSDGTGTAPPPAPQPEPPAPDRAAPRARISLVRCTATRCTFRLTATDPPPGAGVRAVEARVRRSVQVPCRRGGRRTTCTRRTLGVVRPRAAGAGRWVVVVGRPRTGSTQLLVLAVDLAGNRQASPARRSVPRRGR